MADDNSRSSGCGNRGGGQWRDCGAGGGANENLYVACEIPIRPTGYQLRHESKHPDILSHPLYGLVGDDYVKLELWPCADSAADMKYGSLNLQWNAIGTRADWYINQDDGADFKWSPGGALRTVARPDTNWVSELAIPLKSLRYGLYAATNANGATAAKLPPLEASIWRLRFSCKVGEAFNAIAVAGFFPDYEIPAWPANQPLPADEAALLAKAEELYAAGKYAEAFTHYAPISHSFPFSNIRQGRCLQMMGKPLLAIRTYDELLAFLPNQVEYSAPALFYRAQCHYLSGNANEAIKALAQLVKDKDYAKHPAATAGRLLLEGLQAAGERP